MKKIFALPFVFVLMIAPAFALADTGIPTAPTPLQLITRTAALEAQLASTQSGSALACAMLFSASSTPLGNDVILAWGSTGAVEQAFDTKNMRDTAGAVTLLFDQPGTWTYTFTFYDAARAATTCSAKILVTA